MTRRKIYPAYRLGTIFASFVVSIGLLIIGICMIAAGLSGRDESVIPSTADIHRTIIALYHLYLFNKKFLYTIQG